MSWKKEPQKITTSTRAWRFILYHHTISVLNLSIPCDNISKTHNLMPMILCYFTDISTPKDLTIKVYLTNCRCFEHNVFYISLLQTWYIYLSLQQGHRGPGSYGSWIYNYLCNQCLLQLMLWVRLPLRARCTTLWSSLSVICGRSVVFSGYSGFLHQ